MTEIETEAEHGEPEFHARFSARMRTYHYVLYNNPIFSPILHGKVGWMFRPLDVTLMQQGAACLIGTHDFTAFRAAHCQARSPVKLMHEITITRRDDVILFSLCASAFLHHMVRNIVGALVYVGIGKHPPEWMAELLSERNRHLAAPTFMPDGLYLGQIDYDPKWGLPQQTRGFPWF
jgi:tRNA pseudouridine38-40 synthase